MISNKFDFQHIIALTIAAFSGLIIYNLTKSQFVTAHTSLSANECNESNPVPLIQGMAYKDARKLLIDSGWQAPLNLNRGARGATDRQTESFFSQGWVELEACSGTGLGLCRVSFTDAFGRYLTVTTSNNSPDESFGGDNPTVFGWRVEEQSEPIF